MAALPRTQAAWEIYLNAIRAVWRLLKTVAVFSFSILEVLLTRPKTRPERAAWLMKLCQRELRAIDVHVFTHGPLPPHGAVISNHLSFLDIMVHSSLHPCVFVSNAGVRKLPVFGWMSMMAGTVYVERGAGGSAQAAAQTMAKGFRDGLPIVYFPEGTTGDGEAVAPFKSGLLAQTLAAQQPVTAAFIRYDVAERDRKAGLTARKAIYWQEQSLGQLVWRICLLHRVDVHVRFAPQAIPFTEAAIADRKRAAVEARDAVVQLSETPLI